MDTETARRRQRLAKALKSVSKEEQLATIVWWLENGPDDEVRDALAFAMTKVAERVLA